ncbi:MAG: sugar phosphate isomerase/epimerase family protein [Bryobacteraceae bacterium]
MTRRDLLLTSLAPVALSAKSRIERSRLSAITDEIANSPDDAIAFAKQYGLKWVELRAVPNKRGAEPRPGPRGEYALLPEEAVKAAAAQLSAAGLRVSFLNTSLLKFTWPGTEPVRRRPETDEARARRLKSEGERFERRMEDLNKAIRAAHILGVDRIRVFTGTRVEEPRKLFGRMADVLGEMARVAEKQKVQLLVENEGSCNIATSAETADLLAMLPSKAIGINWDPLNEVSQKQAPFPGGYNLLPKKRIGNVQIKGRSVLEGPQKLDWKAIFSALDRDGYKGKIGLETHIFESLIESSHASMKAILSLLET